MPSRTWPYIAHVILIFSDLILKSQQTEQLPSWTVLKEEVQFIFILERHAHLDQEWMLDSRHDLLLSHDVFLLVLLDYVTFL